MTKTTDQILLEAIQGLRNDIARLDRDGGDTREANEHLTMAVSQNTEQVRQFGQRLEIIEKKIQDKVAAAVAPMMEQAQGLQDSIESKKTMVLREKPRSVWKKIFRRK